MATTIKSLLSWPAVLLLALLGMYAVEGLATEGQGADMWQGYIK